MNTKTIIKAIKGTINKNSAVPAVSGINFTGTHLVVSDLETYVRIPYVTDFPFLVNAQNMISVWDTLPYYKLSRDGDTLLFSEGSKKIKVNAWDIEDYPTMSETNYQESIVTLLSNDVKLLSVAADFIGKDELRPVMSFIALEKGKMYATDAQVCMFHPIESDMRDTGLYISNKTRTLLQMWEGDWEVTIGGTRTIFKNDEGIVVDTQTMQGRYPNVEAVIPKENPIELKFIVKEMQDVIKTGEKFASRSHSRMDIDIVRGKTNLSFSNEDYGLSYEAELELCSASDDFSIAFNTKLMNRILKHVGNKAVFRMSEPNRPAVINDTFILMPLMKKKPVATEQDEELETEESQS